MYRNINFIQKKNYLIIITILENLQLFFINLLYFDFHTNYLTIIFSSLIWLINYLIVKFLMKIIFDLNNINFYLFIIYL